MYQYDKTLLIFASLVDRLQNLTAACARYRRVDFASVCISGTQLPFLFLFTVNFVKFRSKFTCRV
eukprot:SAG31_NODE_3813_length_3859_cov_5.983245_1_plen_65_part_00